MYSRPLRFGREGAALDRLVTPSPNRVQRRLPKEAKSRHCMAAHTCRYENETGFYSNVFAETEPITACTIFRNSLVCVRPYCQSNCLYDLDWDGTAVQTNVAPQVTEY